MTAPMGRRDAEALGLADRVTLVEARLDLVDERIAERPQPRPPMSPAEARRLHQRDVVAAMACGFSAVVAALTALGYWAIEAVTS